MILREECAGGVLPAVLAAGVPPAVERLEQVKAPNSSEGAEFAHSIVQEQAGGVLPALEEAPSAMFSQDVGSDRSGQRLAGSGREATMFRGGGEFWQREFCLTYPLVLVLLLSRLRSSRARRNPPSKGYLQATRSQDFMLLLISCLSASVSNLNLANHPKVVG